MKKLRITVYVCGSLFSVHIVIIIYVGRYFSMGTGPLTTVLIT
ncbi:hypothetical protein SAMN04489757_11655 [Anaerocolumna aminovalerica]|uniref:Uncharacterized protein n=1 Tax=Anaerocolumna aminovalerica TaxID=1527 RepID=A0A1I5FXM2_9FIRM|nr:hypothetical protein SAMN04489757_11655 [Anaerocolumna aminovalerica]